MKKLVCLLLGMGVILCISIWISSCAVGKGDFQETQTETDLHLLPDLSPSTSLDKDTLQTALQEFDSSTVDNSATQALGHDTTAETSLQETNEITNIPPTTETIDIPSYPSQTLPTEDVTGQEETPPPPSAAETMQETTEETFAGSQDQKPTETEPSETEYIETESGETTPPQIPDTKIITEEQFDTALDPANFQNVTIRYMPHGIDAATEQVIKYDGEWMQYVNSDPIQTVANTGEMSSRAIADLVSIARGHFDSFSYDDTTDRYTSIFQNTGIAYSFSNSILTSFCYYQLNPDGSFSTDIYVEYFFWDFGTTKIAP